MGSIWELQAILITPDNQDGISSAPLHSLRPFIGLCKLHLGKMAPNKASGYLVKHRNTLSSYEYICLSVIRGSQGRSIRILG